MIPVDKKKKFSHFMNYKIVYKIVFLHKASVLY